MIVEFKVSSSELATAPQAVRDWILGGAGASSVTKVAVDGDSATETKTVPKNKAKADKAKPEPELDLFGDADETPEAPAVTVKEITAACKVLVADDKIAALQKVMKKFGVAKVAELKEDKFAEFMAAIATL